MPALAVTVYGGTAGHDASTGQIGGNKILLEFDDKAYFLDFGTSFGETGRYFDEFLNPRSAVGLRDFLRLALIPPIEGIYRNDLFAHELDCWDRYRSHPRYRRLDHVDGVLLSHAHQDHNGCLGFLSPETPIYTGLMTALIGKAMQDIAGGGPEAQYCYVAPREVNDDGVLKSVTGLRIGRPHYIAERDEPIERALGGLKAFFGDHPGKRTVFHPAPLECCDMEARGIRFFRVDHSIPGSGAFAIRTPIGWVAYSGDLRVHGHSKWRTEKFAAELAALKPALLIVEGTNLSDRDPITEPDVLQASLEVVKREPGLVIADFSARNIERLRTFHDIARELGRRLVVTTKDAYLLERMHVIDPKIPKPGNGVGILKPVRVARSAWEDQVVGEHLDCLVEPKAVGRRPGDFLMCLSYWDITSLIDIEPHGGTYIYSSSEARTEEQKVDHERLQAWLSLFGLESVGGLPGSEAGPFHASGHMHGAGMEWFIETVAPAWILPVHSQKLGWFEERWPERLRFSSPDIRIA